MNPLTILLPVFLSEILSTVYRLKTGSIAEECEVRDGPNQVGEYFIRPGKVWGLHLFLSHTLTDDLRIPFYKYNN